MRLRLVGLIDPLKCYTVTLLDSTVRERAAHDKGTAMRQKIGGAAWGIAAALAAVAPVSAQTKPDEATIDLDVTAKRLDRERSSIDFERSLSTELAQIADARIRFAGVDEAQTLVGDTEILSLSGTVGVDEHGRSHSHLHMAVSTATGAVFGGHVVPGCRVRTTAEVLLGLLPSWSFTREHDAATGFPELRVRRQEP